MAAFSFAPARFELWKLLVAFQIGVVSCGGSGPIDIAQTDQTIAVTTSTEVTAPTSTSSAADSTTTTTTTTAVASTTTTVVSTTEVPKSTSVTTEASPVPTTAPPTTTASTGITSTTSVDNNTRPDDAVQVVRLRFESEVSDVPVAELRETALGILNDPRGWGRAGFSFVADDSSLFRVVLAEGRSVDRMCDPLDTGGTVSCQNGPIVALNADRWRRAVGHWDAEVSDYRGYLVNHEVGHLLGQRHPVPRCPVRGRPAGVMEQQTGGLIGCTGNAWPRDWEIDLASQRPVVYAPLPDWGPDPRPRNAEQ